jgi:hypothetical protein
VAHRRKHIAQFLLTLFILCSVIAPSFHLVDHTLENRREENRAHNHAHPPDGTPTLTMMANPSWAPSDCLFCAPLVYWGGAQHITSTVLAPHPNLPVDGLDTPPSTLLSSRQVRAPPAHA